MKLLTHSTVAAGKVIDITGERPTMVDRHVAEIIIEDGWVIKDKRNGLRIKRSATAQEIAEAKPPQRQMTEIGLHLWGKMRS